MVAVIPMMTLSDHPRRWFLEGIRSAVIWALLCGLFVGGLVRSWRTPDAQEAREIAALFSAPLGQSIVFLVLYTLFRAAFGRFPVSSGEAKYGRTKDGKRYWLDVSYWIFTFLVLIGGAVWVCISNGVDLPSRYHAS
jgi:hypothetical protein